MAQTCIGGQAKQLLLLNDYIPEIPEARDFVRGTNLHFNKPFGVLAELMGGPQAFNVALRNQQEGTDNANWYIDHTCPAHNMNWHNSNINVNWHNSNIYPAHNAHWENENGHAWQRDYGHTMRMQNPFMVHQLPPWPNHVVEFPYCSRFSGSFQPTAFGSFQANDRGFSRTIVCARPRGKNARFRNSGKKYKNKKKPSSNEEVGDVDESFDSVPGSEDAEAPSSNEEVGDVDESSDSVPGSEDAEAPPRKDETGDVDEFSDSVICLELSGNNNEFSSAKATEREDQEGVENAEAGEVEKCTHAVTCKPPVDNTEFNDINAVHEEQDVAAKSPYVSPLLVKEIASSRPASHHSHRRQLEIFLQCILMVYILYRVLVVYPPVLKRAIVTRERVLFLLIN